ncbi:MAG: DUF481 domain-containing protein [Pseudomonadota bacterium]
MFTSFFTLCVSCAMATAADTDGDPAKGADGWDGTIEFSASSASGNTETSVLGARFEAKRIFGRYTNEFKAGVNYAEATTEGDDGEETNAVTQNNSFVEYKLNAQVRDRTFLYSRLRAEQDEFSGFESRYFVGGGVGHAIFDSEAKTWSVLAGPGAQYTVLEDGDDVDIDEEVELALYAGSELSWLVRENVTLEHDLDVTWTNENTTTASVASIKTKLSDALSSRLSYQVKHETDPPEEREATDTLLSASVIFGF